MVSPQGFWSPFEFFLHRAELDGSCDILGSVGSVGRSSDAFFASTFLVVHELVTLWTDNTCVGHPPSSFYLAIVISRMHKTIRQLALTELSDADSTESCQVW